MNLKRDINFLTPCIQYSDKIWHRDECKVITSVNQVVINLFKIRRPEYGVAQWITGL